MTDPRASQQGSSAMGVGHGRALQTQGSAIPWPSPQGHPLGHGTPYCVPDQPFLMIPFDVLTCLEGQTNSESYETRTVVSVSKISSRSEESRVGKNWVFREKPRKSKDTRRKGETTAHDRPPSLPARELGYGGRPWPSPADTRVGHPMAEPPGSPPGAWDPLLCPRSALFDDTLRRFDMFGGSNELGILRNKDRCVRIEDIF